MTEVTDEDLLKGLDRIARTADGELLYLYLQRAMIGTLADHDPSDGALRTEHGRRRFAGELMARMSKGIEESAGSRSSDTSSGKRAERPVVFRTQPAARVAGHVSAREHFRSHDPEYASLAGRERGSGT